MIVCNFGGRRMNGFEVTEKGRGGGGSEASPGHRKQKKPGLRTWEHVVATKRQYANKKTPCEFKFLAIKRNRLFGVLSRQGYFAERRTPNAEHWMTLSLNSETFAVLHSTVGAIGQNTSKRLAWKVEPYSVQLLWNGLTTGTVFLFFGLKKGEQAQVRRLGGFGVFGRTPPPRPGKVRLVA